MNPSECVVVKRLVTELDNTRIVYATLSPLLIRPRLKFLVQGLIESHLAIADDLVGLVNHGRTHAIGRGDGIIARFHASLDRWVAIASPGVEAACLRRIAGYEIQVIERFRRALACVTDLDRNFRGELRELERTLFQVDLLTQQMDGALPRETSA